MQWLGSILTFLDKLGLRGPLFFFFMVVSAVLLRASDSCLAWLRLTDLRNTNATGIEVVFVASTVLTLAFIAEWIRKALRRCWRRVRLNRDHIEMLNGLSTLEHQILEQHFLRDGLRENTVIISDTSVEHDVLIKLIAKRVVTTTQMRRGLHDWRPVPVSVTIVPWAWKIMNSAHYKPNLTGVEKSR
jgi:hypothetical protein